MKHFKKASILKDVETNTSGGTLAEIAEPWKYCPICKAHVKVISTDDERNDDLRYPNGPSYKALFRIEKEEREKLEYELRVLSSKFDRATKENESLYKLLTEAMDISSDFKKIITSIPKKKEIEK